MRLIKLYMIVSLYLHKKSIEGKIADYFSMPNNKGQGTKLLPNCSNINNAEYHIFYDTSSIDNTVNCVAVKKDYLINFCSNKINKQYPEFCSKIYNRLNLNIDPEFKNPLNFHLTLRDVSAGAMGIFFIVIYQILVGKSTYKIVINYIPNLKINNKIEMFEALTKNQDIKELVYENISKSPCHMKNFIESFSNDIDQVYILSNAIASFEAVKKQIAISNPSLVSDLRQYADIDKNDQPTNGLSPRIQEI